MRNDHLAANLSVDYRKRFWKWKRTYGSRYRLGLVADRIAASFFKPNPLFQHLQGKSPIQSVIDAGVFISECIQYTELSD